MEPRPERLDELALAPLAESPAPRPKVTPLSPQRFAFQLTISQSTHDKLRYAQELLSHQIPGGDEVAVLDRALDALIRQLEKRKTVWNDRLAVVVSCRSRARSTLVADRPPRSIAG